MRIESVVAVNATDGVGPTRLALLTASSSRQPVVVVEHRATGPVYHVFDVSGLNEQLAGQLSAVPVGEALNLASRAYRPAVDRLTVPTAAPGDPVQDNGRLIGIVAPDKPEYPEPGESDMARDTSPGAADNAADEPPAARADGKRSLWQRLSGAKE